MNHMIQVYKMFSGLVDVDVSDFFCLDQSSRTRGHNFKIKKQKCRLDFSKNFFSNRVVTEWNDLPQSVVNSTCLSTFNSMLDKHVSAMQLSYCIPIIVHTNLFIKILVFSIFTIS